MPPEQVPDWSHKPTLTGTLVTLRPLVGSDADAMADILDDRDVLRLTGSVNSSAAAAAGFGADAGLHEWYATRSTHEDRLDLAVIESATGHLVGEVVLNDRDVANSSANLRVLIGASGRDRGLGTEAVALLTAYGLDVLGLHRISLEVYAFNPRARHVYEKVGYRYEGTLRQALRWDDAWVDAHVLAILTTDPRPGAPTA
jgi:RimJ/RimL family protein N-acetyltransferase